MNTLPKSFLNGLLICPKPFQRYVIIDDRSLKKLHKAQSLLSNNLRLIVTRGYQPEGIFLKLLRRGGACVFWLLYRNRRREIPEIFGHNGHAAGGTHVDVAIEHYGKRLDTLPLGVFTPLWMLKRIECRYKTALAETRKALVAAGFRIHTNPVEALQIHCDL